MRTFGAILAHIAGASYEFCAAAKGEKPPHTEDEFEKSVTTKVAITKVVSDAIAYCDAAYTALTDKTAADIVNGAFGSGKAARASSLLGNTTHYMEHYGNLVTYFRMKGIVPPSSRPRTTGNGTGIGNANRQPATGNRYRYLLRELFDRGLGFVAERFGDRVEHLGF